MKLQWKYYIITVWNHPVQLSVSGIGHKHSSRTNRKIKASLTNKAKRAECLLGTWQFVVGLVVSSAPKDSASKGVDCLTL
jgi:hypothetical protein